MAYVLLLIGSCIWLIFLLNMWLKCPQYGSTRNETFQSTRHNNKTSNMLHITSQNWQNQKSKRVETIQINGTTQILHNSGSVFGCFRRVSFFCFVRHHVFLNIIIYSNCSVDTWANDAFIVILPPPAILHASPIIHNFIKKSWTPILLGQSWWNLVGV